MSVFPRKLLATIDEKRMLSILVINNFLCFAGMMQTLLIDRNIHTPKSTNEDRTVCTNFSLL